MRPVIYAIAIISTVACATSNAAPIVAIPTATIPNTTLADLFTPLLLVDPASAVRTSPRD
jgi:hypothetical protein